MRWRQEKLLPFSLVFWLSMEFLCVFVQSANKALLQPLHRIHWQRSSWHGWLKVSFLSLLALPSVGRSTCDHERGLIISSYHHRDACLYQPSRYASRQVCFWYRRCVLYSFRGLFTDQTRISGIVNQTGGMSSLLIWYDITLAGNRLEHGSGVFVRVTKVNPPLSSQCEDSLKCICSVQWTVGQTRFIAELLTMRGILSEQSWRYVLFWVWRGCDLHAGVRTTMLQVSTVRRFHPL